MMSRFRSRSTKLERLDTGDYTPAEYARWHREMRDIHRAFGEIRAIRRTLLREAATGGSDRVTILDVGAGSGELLRAIGKDLGQRPAYLVGAELDAEAARAISAGNDISKIDAVRCDALQMPFADDSFDYVICSLFLHHLTDDDAVRLLAEMSRVAAKRIFVIDLHRHPVAYYFYRAAASVLLQRFTREDGALSILRSFTPGEMGKLAEAAGVRDISVRRSAAYRLVLSGK
ncbi:MAG: methyltransferase domain-containing protein [Pyrinomonadaceae bacterium]|nr:methyltransferase domain-containing protein [Pyrinomonadaceae bacterium]